MSGVRTAWLRTGQLHDSLRWLPIFGVGLVVLAIIVLFAARGVEIRRLQAELAQLEIEKTKTQSDINNLQVQLQKQGDLKLVEYLARKELGLIKSGEEVYLLVEEDDEENR